MKRRAVLQKIKKAARSAGLPFDPREATRHTEVRVGSARTRVARHSEIPEEMAEVIFKQLEGALGEDWWRK